MTNPEPVNLASNALGKKRVLNDTQNDSLLSSPYTKRRKISKKKKSTSKRTRHSSSSSNTNHTSTNIENNKNSNKNETNIKNISVENKSESSTISSSFSSNSNPTKNKIDINEVTESNPFALFMNNGWTKTQKTKHIKEYLYCRPIPPLNLSKLNDIQKQELRSAFEILDDGYMNDIMNKHSSKVKLHSINQSINCACMQNKK